MDRKVALLLWAPTLGLAGAQTTQLLVEPLWRPAVLWDGVTLTCQGSGTVGATTWYKDGQPLGQEGRDRLTVTKSGTYTCDRPDTGHNPPLTVSHYDLVLQVPVRALMEGDTVTLRCRGWQNYTVSRVSFYEDTELEEPRDGIELFLYPLQLSDSGSYHCEGLVSNLVSKRSASKRVTVTVRRVPVSGVSLSEQPPRGQMALGDRLVLSCTVAKGTGALSFSWHREGSGALLGTSSRLELQYVGDNDSSQYWCWVSDGNSVAESDPLNVTVLVPVANATITPSPLSHQVRSGDVTLRCSVQVGSALVTFTWLHNGQEVARGPMLELGDINVGHSGTYQCVTTNQLGQDGHRLFRALSPERALTLPRRRWKGLPGSPGPPEEGEVLYTHVMVTKRAGVASCATILQDPQVTYPELRGHQGRPREPGDIYGNQLPVA
ncbi:LOW QUALITY PROTEIN: Fc receptor-like protein 2 [Haemorhous mexicanus]|uniref:LOW QUALITY PROTEIN: Fc receptor-like protein 2 n=1 Tax=Haemorhous mexicanus TaxID=30427 RepID=UPI0028BF440C|nr:LOW QUALITY PROTEIN: Fc receptor-like protein 2 [Haemorhous mexicanus]